MPTITFRRASNIQNIPITDGQIIFDTSRNIILMDNGNIRNQYAGATQLVSTTPEATSTNAFNAQATTQLFLQKTTVIDTKANALAVNQNYIPLGCLAFKEALGTSNYSSIGNGTISGALVTLNNKDTKLNNQLSANNNEFYFDYQNGKYGYNTDPNRGADTFTPFNNVFGGTVTSIGLPYIATEDCIVFVAATYPGLWNDGFDARWGQVTISKNNSVVRTVRESLNTSVGPDEWHAKMGIPLASWCGALRQGDTVSLSFNANGYSGGTRANAWVMKF